MMKSDLAKWNLKNHKLRLDQQKNVLDIFDISRSLAHDAELECCNFPTVQDGSIILESGHQPNYFPYSGVWKKVFLLNQFQEQLAKKEIHGIAVFGFADQNSVTAPFLYKNQVPALNKSGKQKIGFAVKGPEKWKCFNKIPKPLPEIWEDEMEKIAHFYSGTRTENQEIIEIMWRCYKRAESFSDLNAYIFSRISRDILGLDVFFFRYSDIQHSQLFSRQCKQILENVDSYNKVYNAVIKDKYLSLRPVVSGEIPFWYHCDCGGKTPLEIDSSGVCRGTCPICKMDHELNFETDFSQYDTYSRKMSISAVCRNVVFSEGLGTHLFISGSGGGLQYGKISNAISSDMGFNQPVTVSWSSKDYYLGNIHKFAVDELKKTFSLSKEDLLNPDLDGRICEIREKMALKINEMELVGTDKKTLRLHKGRYISSAQTTDKVSKIFSTVPSMLDIFMNFDKEDILDGWRKAFNNSVPEWHVLSCILKYDAVYGGNEGCEFSPEEIVVLYHNMCAIGGKITNDKTNSHHQSSHR